MNNIYVKLAFNRVKYLFNYVCKDEIDGRKFLVIPYKDGIPDKKFLTIIRKLNSKIKNDENVILPMEILNNEAAMNILRENKIQDGRWLFKFLIEDVIRYILEIQDIAMYETEICFLVNDNSGINLDTIETIAKQVKRVKIITNNINNFRFIEEKLYSDDGISIVITNNRKKSLARANMIINIDFDEKLLNGYKINREAIIINIEDKVQVESKGFEGININYYKLSFPREIKEELIRFRMQGRYDENALYESFIWQRGNLKTTREILGNDGIRIDGMLGNNGLIDESEYKRKINV